MQEFEIELPAAPSAAPGESPSERLYVRIARDLAAFGDVWPRIDNLGDTRAYVFQCAGIVEAWIDTFGRARGTEIVLVLVEDADRAPLMAFALGIETRSHIRLLSFLDAGVSDYNAPILFPRYRSWDKAKFPALWTRLLDLAGNFDACLLTKLPPDIEGIANPLLQLKAAEGMTSAHCATLPASPEEAAKRVIPHAKGLRRKRRRLEERGEVSFLVAESEADKDRVLEAMIRQKTRKYLETRGFDGFQRPGFREYYAELTRRSGPAGPAHLSAFMVGDRIIASHWGLLAKDRFYSLMPAFDGDEEWARRSPGRMLLEHLIEWSIARGYRLFDFGIGDEEYKDEYCDKTIPLYEVVRARTIRGYMFVSLYKTLSSLKRTTIWRALKDSVFGRLVRSILKR